LALRFRQNVQAHLRWDKAVLELLAEEGYDPAYGARPLRRLIQHEVETLLSRQIISGQIAPEDTVTLSASGNEIVLRIQHPDPEE